MPKHRSAKLIHITIRSKSKDSIPRNKSNIAQISSTNRSLVTSEKISINNESLTTKNIWFKEKSVINDYHQRPKKKKKQCALKSLFIVSLLICVITITIICLVLFIKPKPAATHSNQIHLLRWNKTGITIIGDANSPGKNASQVRGPWSLTLDWEDNMYVTDRGNHRVQKFRRGSKIGVTVAGNANGIAGNNLASFNQCTGIYVDENQNIYVSEYYNHRVTLWTPGSTSGIIITGNGTAGNENDRLDRPHDIQRDFSTGIVYVSDYGNHRIMRYLPNSTFGTKVAGGNIGGNNHTLINFPLGLHRDLVTNSFIIANSNGANVIQWHSGDSNWTQLAGILGKSDMTPSTFRYPTDVTIDPMGNVYVVDLSGHRIQFFLIGEFNGTTIAGVTNQTGSTSNLLYQPSSIILDNQLNLYVADYSNHRVQKFLRY